LADAAASALAFSFLRTAMSEGPAKKILAPVPHHLSRFFAALAFRHRRDFNQLDGQGRNLMPRKRRCNRQSNSRSTNIPNQDAVNRHIYWTDP